ncbi:MAG: helix-hairpin-helix domain-containing protein [Polyangiaceae bacterium]|nr:helix-hairpin-helix domain-containing protein [Polyangiaceae bacterium]
MNTPAVILSGQSKIVLAMCALSARYRSSTFAPLLVRAIGIGAALVLLAWIGRSAIASSAATTTYAPSNGDRDSGVALGLTDNPPPVETPLITENDAAAPASETEIATELQLDAGTALPVEHAGGARTRATPADPVVLNTAGEDEFRRLPGVGAKRAAAIVALRRRIGRFQRIEDLMRVKGIGRTAIRKWRPLVRLDAPNAVDAGSTPSP